VREQRANEIGREKGSSEGDFEWIKPEHQVH